MRGCPNVYNAKVHLLSQFLKDWKYPLLWLHFGDKVGNRKKQERNYSTKSRAALGGRRLAWRISFLSFWPRGWRHCEFDRHRVGHKQFLVQISDIGNYFLERHGYRTERFTRVSTRAALEDIRETQSYGFEALSGLNALAESYLFNSLLLSTNGMTFETGSFWGDLIDNQIDPEYIEQAVNMAIQTLKKKKERTTSQRFIWQ